MLWQQRDLAGKKYVYFWADGIYCNVRVDDKQCLLVFIGATEDGRKELVAIDGGFRESELSWSQLMADLKGRAVCTKAEVGRGDSRKRLPWSVFCLLTTVNHIGAWMAPNRVSLKSCLFFPRSFFSSK